MPRSTTPATTTAAGTRTRAAGRITAPYGFSVGLFFGWPYYRRPYYDPFFVGRHAVLQPVLLQSLLLPSVLLPAILRARVLPGVRVPLLRVLRISLLLRQSLLRLLRQSLLRQLRQSVLSGRRWRSLHSVSFPAGGWSFRQLPRPSIREHGLHAAGGARPVSEREPRPSRHRHAAGCRCSNDRRSRQGPCRGGRCGPSRRGSYALTLG